MLVNLQAKFDARTLCSPVKHKPVLPLRSVRGDNKTPPWTSMSPTGGLIQHCDLAVWEHCAAAPRDWELLSNCWFANMLCTGMLVQETAGNSAASFYVSFFFPKKGGLRE